MMKKLLLSLCALLLWAAAVTPLQAAETGKTRLFILSGQSNMKHIEPEEFSAAIKKAFPNDDIITVKLAQSGQPILRWHAEWKPASGAPPDVKKGKMGDMYVTLMEMVEKAIKDKPKPESVVFVWMQGEADTKDADHWDAYEASLKTVIKKMRDDLKRPDMFFVVGRISDYAERPEGSKKVRAALMSVAETDPRGAWVDTDDLNGKSDGLHYTGEGYKLLTERFAEKAIKFLSSAPVKN